MARIALVGTLVFLALVGCAGVGGGAEQERIENAIQEQLDDQFARNPDPPTATGVESVECGRYEDEFFREAQVFTCEVEANDRSVYGPFCAALVGDDLYFSGGRTACEDDFSRRF